MIYAIKADSPWDACEKVPPIGSTHPEKPDLVASKLDAVQTAPNVFRVEVTFEPVLTPPQNLQ